MLKHLAIAALLGSVPALADGMPIEHGRFRTSADRTAPAGDASSAGRREAGLKPRATPISRQSSDPRALRVARAVEAGNLSVNSHSSVRYNTPFGGFKQSGLGRELGREGLEAFQETKHVHVETKIERKEWWYPYGEGTGEPPPHG